MDVSVIIVNYNTKDLTLNCIRSVYDSKTRYIFEIILVDNASSDGSVEAIRDSFPEVIIISNKENVGFGRANNQAAEVSGGRYLYILNSDTEIEDDVIEKVVSYGDANQQAGIIGNRAVFPDGRVQESVYKFPSLLSELVFFTISIIKTKNNFLFNLNKYKDYLTNDPVDVDVIAGFSMFIKREIYERIGLFNEQIFMYYEDDELCYRVKKIGYKNIYFPAATIKHIHRGSSKKYDENYEMLVACFEGACIYFREAKSNFHALFFKAACTSLWYAELLFFGLSSLITKSEKLKKKINMFKALINKR